MGTWIEIHPLPLHRTAGTVVPYVGTWIEIKEKEIKKMENMVVPYVGTWIEILLGADRIFTFCVVPYVGTWIEMLCSLRCTDSGTRRSLRGNVDRNMIIDISTERET